MLLSPAFAAFPPPRVHVSKYTQALQLNSLSVLVLSLKCILKGTSALSCFRNDVLGHKLCLKENKRKKTVHRIKNHI